MNRGGFHELPPFYDYSPLTYTSHSNVRLRGCSFIRLLASKVLTAYRYFKPFALCAYIWL